MGQLFSQTSSSPSSSSEEVNANAAGSYYRYPPKEGGNYFASHFIMGGEKFDCPQPESFLFGDNADLNCLGPRPLAFPYPPPPANEPNKTLRSQINIRRDSVHFVPLPLSNSSSEDGLDGDPMEGNQPDRKYNIRFTFDSDVQCAITLHYFCQEEVHSHGLNYVSVNSDLSSPTYVYNKGSSQVFDQPSHVFSPSTCWSEIEKFKSDPELGYSLVIQCIALTGPEPKQCHVTLATIAKNEGHVVLRSLKQKIFVDGLCYFLQEIYGLENKSLWTKQNADEEVDDDCGEECVVCLCDLRDTLILPCRHLCLCHACAESLRYQASNCPICRNPFRAMLRIRAVQKVGQVTHPAVASGADASENGLPSGYKPVSLVEILNGPLASSASGSKSKEKKKKKSKNRSSTSRKESRSSRATASVNYVDEVSADATTPTSSRCEQQSTISTSKTSVASLQDQENGYRCQAEDRIVTTESLKGVSRNETDSDFADCHESFMAKQEIVELAVNEDFTLPANLKSGGSSRTSQRSLSSSSSSEQLLSHAFQQSVGSAKIVTVHPVQENSGVTLKNTN